MNLLAVLFNDNRSSSRSGVGGKDDAAIELDSHDGGSCFFIGERLEGLFILKQLVPGVKVGVTSARARNRSRRAGQRNFGGGSFKNNLNKDGYGLLKHTNSEYLGALGRQQHLLVQVVEQREVVGVDVDAVEDLAHGGHAAARRTLHLQLFPLYHVLVRQVGRVYGRDEDLVVRVLLVLEL